MKQNARSRQEAARTQAGSPEEARRVAEATGKLAAEAARLLSTSRDAGEGRFWQDALISHIPDCLFAKDRQSRFTMANQATAQVYELEDGRDLCGLTDFDLHEKSIAQGFFDIEQKIMETGEPRIDMEEHLIEKGGRHRWQSTSKMPLFDASGKVVGLVCIARDITGRKQAENLNQGQTRLLGMIAKRASLTSIFEDLIHLIESQLSGVRGSILLLSADGEHLEHGAAPSLDPAYCKMIDGVEIGPKAGSCGTAAWRQEPVIVSDTQSDPLWEDYKALALEYELISCWSAPIHSYQGKLLGTFALYSDKVRTPTAFERELVGMATHIAGIAIERKQAEDRIKYMANHDVLTGLPNRASLEERVGTAMRRAAQRGRWVTVAYIDLDGFNLVNDSFGHQAGDALLVAVAERMRASVRRSDHIFRMGGDEFVVLLNNQPCDADYAKERMETIRRAIATPLTIDGRTIQVTCSMGVATFPDNGTTVAELLSHADAALNFSKRTGRNGLQLFSGEMLTESYEKLQRQTELREAVRSSQFTLHFQPQMDLKTGRIFAAEALVRWEHPEKGIVSPASFIPLAEETGLIVELGDWVLHAACRQAKAWQEAGLPEITISVNVSARQFNEADWVDRVAHALQESGLEARYLELELTESLIMQDVKKAVATMYQLEALGVRLAIDDFGTGYSSLSSLKSFPVDRLKIDKSFVQDLPEDGDDRAIAAAIISLAQKLDLKVIAEGVETAGQVAFLRESGCDEIQGYFLSKPVTAENFALLLLPGEAA